MINGVKARLESVVKNYYKNYELDESSEAIRVKTPGGVDIITVKISDENHYAYHLEEKFISSFFRMNKLFIDKKNVIIGVKKFNSILSRAIINEYEDKFETKLPLDQTDLTYSHPLTFSAFELSAIEFVTVALPVINSKHEVKDKNFHAIIFTTNSQKYALPIKEIIDSNIKYELSLELMKYFKPKMPELDGLGDLSGLESMFGALSGADLGG